MKKIVTILIAAIFVCCSASPSFADGGKVTYDGKAKQVIFEPGSTYSPTDLFPNFKDVMPGDTLTQKITVKNDADQQVKVKIYLRALGAHEGSVPFLSQLGLTVQKSAENEMPYMFESAANETAQLTDWVCLGTLYSGGEVLLDVTLNVPIELGNEFQSQIGYLDWEFMIEEFPIEPEDPKPPYTGDQSNIVFWFILLIVALFVMILLILWRKKEKETEE